MWTLGDGGGGGGSASGFLEQGSGPSFEEGGQEVVFQGGSHSSTSVVSSRDWGTGKEGLRDSRTCVQEEHRGFSAGVDLTRTLSRVLKAASELVHTVHCFLDLEKAPNTGIV